MKHRIFFAICSCAMLISCSVEKKLYSSGYHIEWLNCRKVEQNVIQSERISNNQIICSVNNSDQQILKSEEIASKEEEQVSINDTIVPINPAQTDEEYVTPNIVDDSNGKEIGLNELKLNPEGEEKLNKLSQYLIASAFGTMLPMLSILYPIVFIVNIFIIRKIRALAKISNQESHYLKQIKLYWKIILWPFYLALVITLFAFLLILLNL